MYHIQVDNKNAILELLKADKEFSKIYVAYNAYKDSKTQELVKEARKRDIEIIKLPRRSMDKKTKGGSKSVIGMLVSQNSWSLDDLLTDLFIQKQPPFFVILDNLKYTHNLGSIMRTAYASGVNGVIVPVRRESYIDGEVTRISMGASERVPLVEIGLFDAIKRLKEEDIKIIGLEKEGEIHYKSDLKGPVAFVLGSEDEGISSKMLERIDKKVYIPKREGLGEINIAVGAGILCYEKLRQEVT